jgi:gliding motility-associated-like protein
MTHVVLILLIKSLKVKNFIYKVVLIVSCLSSVLRGYSQCGSIDFTADQTTVCAPELVRFYAQNIPAGSTIAWDFGFGENVGKDTGQNIYTTPGNYTVVLKVTLSDGVTVCTVNKPNFISVLMPPTPSFSVSRNVLCNGPDSVTITDNSIGGIGREWVVEGLPIADTSKTITYNFNSTGYKDVLMILKSANCASTFYKVDSAIRIYNPLVFDFTASTVTGCAPATINFTPTISTAGHTINSFDWTFTGGTPATSNSSVPSIVYSSAGDYDASLTLTNTDGCSQTVSKPNYMLIGDTSDFSIVPSKSTICRSEDVTLTISDPSLQGTFIWDLGNGVPQAGSTPKQQLVRFNDTGDQFYKVFREYNGCKMERTYFTDVYVRPPLARFTILNSVECDPNSRIFVFNTTKVDPTTTNSYRWNLFDPNGTLVNTSTDSVPTFSTNSFGQYELQLIVTTPAGCSDSITRDEIFRRTGVGNFTILPEASCPGGTVSFISNSAAFSSAEPNIYFWTVYDTDGTTVLHTENSGIIPRLNYVFNSTGTYSVNLVVYNSKCRDTVKVNKTVDIVSPLTNISVSDPLPCVKTPITLSAGTTPNIVAPGYTYTWTLTNQLDTSIKFTGVGDNVGIVPDTAGIYDLETVVEWGVGCKDVITNNAFVSVSGPVLSISSTNFNDCLPLTSNVSSSLIANHNYKNPANNIIDYTWQLTPLGGMGFNDAKSPNTQFTINTNGEYYLRLIVENGSGCVDTIFEPNPIYAGVESDYELSKDIICTFETITSKAQSLYKPDRFQWVSNPPGAIFTPSGNVETPSITFPDSGTYLVSQIASKRNTCYDTFVTTVSVTQTIADFSSSDTLNYCAPVNVTFKSAAVNADNLIWEFGDGKTLTTSNADSIVYIYFKNSPPTGFNVKLKAVNNIGCADSITRFGYIRIDGPVPDFKINITQGCEPLSVDIVDNSLSYSEYYFDYGDGSAFDTTGAPGTHIYTTDNSNDEISRFRPSLFLLDPLGCFSETKYPFDIEVYKQPIVKFEADTLEGCRPFRVSFTDSTRFGFEYQWDFDGNGFVNDTAKNPVYTYTTPGIKTVRLRVRSQYGCVKNDSIEDYITVYDLPSPAFTFSKEESDTAFIYYNFNSQSINFSSLEWFIDSGLVETQPSFRYGFRDTGATNVRLVALSFEGCRDSVDTLVRIVPDFFFHIPNAFTPNGREGNEKFGPVTPPWAKRYIMRIFNRYGQQMFETDRVAEQWDGNFKDYPAQDGVYVYVVEYLDVFGVSHVYQGTFLLLR